MSALVISGLRRLASDTGKLFAPPPHESMMPEAIPFQSPIDEICARPAPRFLRNTFHLVVALFLALVVLGAVTKVDVVVVARGRLVTVTPPITLQSVERAIVRQIVVHPGDVVIKGQILATLDPTFADADSANLEEQARGLRAQMRRLEAEAADQPYEAAATPDREDVLQALLYHQRRDEYATRLQVFDQDIARLQAGMRTLDDGRVSAGHEVEIARSVETMRSSLAQMQVGSRLALLDAQAARLRSERDQQEATNRIAELQHSVESRVAERAAFVDGWRRELLESQVTARTRLAQVTAELAKASRLHDLVVVKAPSDGVVLEVAARSAGSVLREAETLITMIPRGEPLIAEVAVASSDVGYTEPGAETKLKIDAYPFEYHGMLGGRLLSIAEESFTSNGSSEAAGGSSGAIHRARIELTDMRLDHVPGGARLFPGMTLSAEIKAGSRSVLSYFVMPLTRGLQEAAREP